MALAIDTDHLLHQWMPVMEQRYNNRLGYNSSRSGGRRLLLHRVCVYARVGRLIRFAIQSQRVCLRALRGFSNTDIQAGLDWQADQGDDEGELEVLYHLMQIAAKHWQLEDIPLSDWLRGTILFANAQSPTFTSAMQGRSPSSFLRYSFREISHGLARHDYHDNVHKTHFRHADENIRFMESFCCLEAPALKVKPGNDKGVSGMHVLSYVQLDFLDLSTPITCPTSRLGKRRRTVDLFHRLLSEPREEDTSRGTCLPGSRKFKGVRFRRRDKRWIAEMTPPGEQKVYLGQFKTETEAARVVDVAFHHYHKPLNFPEDTPQILSKQPTSAGLDAKEKLNLVKEQVKWMKNILPSLVRRESTPSAAAAGGVASGQNYSTADSSGLRPFSKISSSFFLDGTDEADDGTSQPRPWRAALMADSGVEDETKTMDQNIDLEHHTGVVNGSGKGQSTTQRTLETAIADPSDVGVSPEHSGGTLTNFSSFLGPENLMQWSMEDATANQSDSEVSPEPSRKTRTNFLSSW